MKRSVTAPRPSGNRIIRFFGEIISELRKVVWLTRREIIYLTGLVLIASLAAGVVLGVFDYSFDNLVKRVFLGM